MYIKVCHVPDKGCNFDRHDSKGCYERRWCATPPGRSADSRYLGRCAGIKVFCGRIRATTVLHRPDVGS